jgi:hypothetical protein
MKLAMDGWYEAWEDPGRILGGEGVVLGPQILTHGELA